MLNKDRVTKAEVEYIKEMVSILKALPVNLQYEAKGYSTCLLHSINNKIKVS